MSRRRAKPAPRKFRPVPPTWEASAWLRAKVAQLAAEAAVVSKACGGNVLVCGNITPAPADPAEFERWRFTCDRCGTYNPGACTPIVVPCPGLLIEIGLCNACYALEGIR